MKTTEQLIREITDREAIRDLPNRYCDFLCRNELDALVSLFIEEGTFAVQSPENEVITRGRVELKKMYEHVVSEVHPQPYVHTQVIELQGANSATGRCYVEIRSGNLGTEWIGSGYFEDNYAKVHDEWKFVSRRLIEIGMATPLRTFMAS